MKSIYLTFCLVIFLFTTGFGKSILNTDTLNINKLAVDTSSNNEKKPDKYYVSQPRTIYKNAEIKVNDILFFTESILPSADLRTECEISSPELIVFVDSHSFSKHSDPLSNGGDGSIVKYYFKAIKEGSCKIIIKNLLHGQTQYQTEVSFEIKP